MSRLDDPRPLHLLVREAIKGDWVTVHDVDRRTGIPYYTAGAILSKMFRFGAPILRKRGEAPDRKKVYYKWVGE